MLAARDDMGSCVHFAQSPIFTVQANTNNKFETSIVHTNILWVLAQKWVRTLVQEMAMDLGQVLSVSAESCNDL